MTAISRSDRGAAPMRVLLTLFGLVGVTLLSACHSTPNPKNLKKATAESLYKAAHTAMVRNDFEYAIRQYEALTSRFPFTNEARQARLDLIYVYYRKGEKESAIDAADQFLRENPTHARIDYAWYMKGRIYYEHTPYAFERFFGVDMALRPPSDALKSISAFNTVVTDYPKSEYAFDAQRRLIFMRNRLADYEVNVAHYYIKRGAWVAAAQRAQQTVEQFDGAPAVQDALDIMIDAYQHLGQADLERNVRAVRDLNFPPGSKRHSVRKLHWWQPRN